MSVAKLRTATLGGKAQAFFNAAPVGEAAATTTIANPSRGTGKDLARFAKGGSTLSVLNGKHDKRDVFVTIGVSAEHGTITNQGDVARLFNRSHGYRYVIGTHNAQKLDALTEKSIGELKRSEPNWKDDFVIFVQPRINTFTSFPQTRAGNDLPTVVNLAGAEDLLPKSPFSQESIADALANSIIRPNPAVQLNAEHPRVTERAAGGFAYVCLCSLRQWCVVYDVVFEEMVGTISNAQDLPIPTSTNPLRGAYRSGYIGISVPNGYVNNVPSVLSITPDLVGKSIFRNGDIALDDTKFWSSLTTAQVEAKMAYHGAVSGSQAVVVTDDSLDLSSAGVNGYRTGVYSSKDAAIAGIDKAMRMHLTALTLSSVQTGMIVKNHLSLLSKTGESDDWSGSLCYSVASGNLMTIAPKTAISGIHAQCGALSSGTIVTSEALLESLSAARKFEIDADTLALAFAMISSTSARDVSRIMLSLWSNDGWSDSFLSAIAIFYSDWCKQLRGYSARAERRKDKSKFTSKIVNYAGIVSGLEIESGIFVFPNGAGIGTTPPISLSFYIRDMNAKEREFKSNSNFEVIKKPAPLIYCMAAATVGGSVFPVFGRGAKSNLSVAGHKFASIGLVGKSLRELAVHISAVDLAGAVKPVGDWDLIEYNPNLFYTASIIKGGKMATTLGKFHPIKASVTTVHRLCVLVGNQWRNRSAVNKFTTTMRNILTFRCRDVDDNDHDGYDSVDEDDLLSVATDQALKDAEEEDEEGFEEDEEEDDSETPQKSDAAGPGSVAVSAPNSARGISAANAQSIFQAISAAQAGPPNPNDNDAMDEV